MPDNFYQTINSDISRRGLEGAQQRGGGPFAVDVPLTPRQKLEQAVKAGDPNAIAQIQAMVGSTDRTKSDDANWARTVANAYLGGQYQTEHHKASLLDELKFPAMMIGGAALGAGGASLAGLGALGAAIPAAPAFPAAASASALGALGGGAGAAGLGAGISGAAGAAGAGAAGAGAAGGALPAVASGAGALGTIGKIGKGVLDYGPLALGALGAIGAGKQNAQADKLRAQALGMATQDYASRAPLRDAAISRALAPIKPRENLNSMFADPYNPYSKPVPR